MFNLSIFNRHPRPSIADACSYVLAKEAEWGVPEPHVMRAVMSCHHGCPMVDIRTEDNNWSVWYEAGELYGEC